MFLLAFHIVSVAMIIVIVWAIAYRRGLEAGERRTLRRLAQQAEDSRPLTNEPPSAT